MKISTRLSAGFGLLILLFVLCTGIAVHALWQAREGMNDTVDVKMKRFALVVDMQNGVRDMAIAVRNLALLSDPAQMQPEWQRLAAQRDIYIHKRELLQKSMSVNVSPQGKAALERTLSAEDAALSTLMTAGKLGRDNRQQEATAYLMTTARPAQKILLNALDDFTTVQMQQSRHAVTVISADTSRTTVILSGLALLSVLLSVATCYLLVRMLMRQLGGEPAQARALAAAIAAGDLTSPVTLCRGDTASLLASLDGMQANLRGLVSQIKDASASVALAAGEISQGNTELSSRTEQQAAALQETAASMEQLTATVKSNAAGARTTADTARETATLARAGDAE